MKLIEYLNDEKFNKYIKVNNINDDDLSIVDIVKYDINSCDKYLKYKSIYNYKPNNINININTNNSIFNYLDNIYYDKLTYKNIIIKYIKGYNNKLIDDVFKIFKIKNNLSLYTNILNINITSNISYGEFINEISKNNYYIHSLMNTKDYKRYFCNNIYNTNDLKTYLTENIYEKEKDKLLQIYTFSKIVNSININTTILNTFILKLDNLYIYKLYIKNKSYNQISKITQKQIIKDVEMKLINYFDFSYGYILIKYLFTLNNGYFLKENINNSLYEITHYLITNNKLYKVYYNDLYEIYTSKIVDDTNIINSYEKFIDKNEYNKLILDLNNLFLKHHIILSKKIITKRIKKVYKRINDHYYKGKLFNYYIIKSLYDKYYSDGITDLNEFINKVKVSNIYMYIKLCNGKYVLKENNNLQEYINEIQKKMDIFKVEDIKKIINEKENIIKNNIIKTKLCYQLKTNTFIRKDKIILPKNLIEDIKTIEESKLYEYILYSHKYFIDKYQIKQKRYLNNIIKQIKMEL